MKLFCYLLFLLNIGYLMWQFHAGGLNPIESPPSSESAILLVSEYARAERGVVISGVLDQQVQSWKNTEIDRFLSRVQGIDRQVKWLSPTVQTKPVQQRSEPTRIEVVTPTPPVIRKCYQFGPFASESMIRQWLGKNGLSHQQIFHRDTVLAKDFQVFFPAAKTPEQTRIDKMLLAAKGLQDIWMITSGEPKGGFSLGVFNDKQRAMVFKSQLAEQGIRAEIQARGDLQTKWFVTLMLDKNQRQSLESLGVELGACSVR